MNLTTKTPRAVPTIDGRFMPCIKSITKTLRGADGSLRSAGICVGTYDDAIAVAQRAIDAIKK